MVPKRVMQPLSGAVEMPEGPVLLLGDGSVAATSREVLESLYPGFVHDDAFYLAEFVACELGAQWSLACLPNGSFAVSPTQRRFKAALLFTKIPD